jgi:hypothetical protein
MSGERPIPDRFALVIGAMKGGTTSLFDYLRTHPQILGSRKKEPNFFAAARIFQRGPEQYYGLWESFDPAAHRWVLEASPNYTKHPLYPLTAERIARFPGRFRFIYVLRDPVDRIESHIAHNIARGRLTPGNWEDRLEPTLATSRYAAQLDRFTSVMAEPEVLLLDFAELRDDPLALLGRCTRFLDVDPDFAFAPRPPSNPGKALPEGDRFRLAPEMRARLRAELAPDMARLRRIYGFDTSAWETEPEPRPDRIEFAAPVAAPVATPAGAPAAGTRARQRGRAVRPPRRTGYWKRRRDLMYYRYVFALAERLAAPARSLIDVGSNTTSLAEELDWIPERVALDISNPYASEAVRGVRADFLAFEPEARFDFALCLQVLEHIPDATAFARKLQEVAERVLVSVPYQWPAGACDRHCQDPVDETKLAGWFGRAPDYQIIVQEPLRRGPVGRRLIAYFHTPGERFRPRDYPRPGSS